MTTPLSPELQAVLDRIAKHPRVPAEPEEPKCYFCSSAGWITWRPEDRSGPCPVCVDGMAAMGVPERFRGADLPTHFDGLREVQGWRGEAPGWYLYGPVGVGKSHLAAALCRETAHARRKARFVPTAAYLERLRQAIDDPNVALDARYEMEQLGNADVVVLDDLGSENLSPWAQEQLLLLVNKLYNSDNTALIVTTNLAPPELAESLGERMTSRIAGLTTLLQLRGPDRRRVGKTKPRLVQP